MIMVVIKKTPPVLTTVVRVTQMTIATCGGQVSTASNGNSSASNHRMRDSGSQLSGSYSTSPGNDNSGNTPRLYNVQYYKQSQAIKIL